jgi:hypothetical protein
MAQRLPIPGGDVDVWGSILNAFLEVSLNADGTLNEAAVIAALGTSGVTPGTYGDATHVSQVTVDSAGLVTHVANVAFATTGDVTFASGMTTLQTTENVEQVVRSQSLDQMAPAQAAVNLNGNYVANATNAGLIMPGAVYYAPSGGSGYTTGTPTFAAVDTTNLTTSFVCPPNITMVIVELTGLVGLFAPSGTDSILFGLFTHSTTTQVGCHAVVYGSAYNTETALVTARIPVSGLSPGTTYSWDWAWACAGGGTALMTARGVTSGAGQATDGAPAVMRVVLP